MDDRFPQWLRKALSKLDFLGLPNLGMLICGLAVLGFLGQNLGATPFERFMFDPEAVAAGEWWRLFAFPVSEGMSSNMLFMLFYVLYVYFVMNSLEEQWGPGPLTVFVLLSYIMALGGAVLTTTRTNIWYYVLENVSLAFGTLFPNFELMLFFILPVKAKWLALIAGGIILLQFIGGDLSTKVFLLAALFPYLLFFSPMLYSAAKNYWLVRKRRQKFDEDMWR